MLLELENIPEILSDNCGVSQIEENDSGIFQTFWDNDLIGEYANTWTYTTQASNCHTIGGSPYGYKYVSDNFVAAIGLYPRPLDGKLCFHIINPQGQNIPIHIKQLCLIMHDEFGLPIYIKKVKDQVYKQILSFGAYPAQEYPWHEEAPLEDDTYPELVMCVSKLLQLFESPGYNQVKDKYRRFHRQLNGTIPVWKELDSSTSQHALNVVQTFFYYKNERCVDISLPHDYWNMILQKPPYRSSGDYIRKVLFIEGQPVAVLVLERVGCTKTMGLYCNIALYQQRHYLSEYVLVQAAQFAKERGIDHINLGGSESLGLYNFKLKFQPEKRCNLSRWAIYNGDI